MKYIICGQVGNARYKIEGIYNGSNKDDVKKYVKSGSSYMLEFKNGDTYMTVPMNENARGNRCDKIFLGNNVDKDFIDRVLLPFLVHSKLPKEEQIELF